MTDPHPRKDHHHHDHHGDRQALRVAVVTVSDTRTAADDTSGALASELLRNAGHEIVRQCIVPDDRAAIVGAIRDAVANHARVVVLTGGTGIAPRDVTYEAVASILEKTLDGFGEAFRRLSWDEIGPRAVLSRAIAGVYDRALIAALPGSTKAVRLGVEQVLLPIAHHAVALL